MLATVDATQSAKPTAQSAINATPSPWPSANHENRWLFPHQLEPIIADSSSSPAPLLPLREAAATSATPLLPFEHGQPSPKALWPVAKICPLLPILLTTASSRQPPLLVHGSHPSPPPLSLDFAMAEDVEPIATAASHLLLPNHLQLPTEAGYLLPTTMATTSKQPLPPLRPSPSLFGQSMLLATVVYRAAVTQSAATPPGRQLLPYHRPSTIRLPDPPIFSILQAMAATSIFFSTLPAASPCHRALQSSHSCGRSLKSPRVQEPQSISTISTIHGTRDLDRPK